jgi:Zn-dependent protease
MGVGRIVTAIAMVASYLAMIVIHEMGHAMVARNRGCHVRVIEIYPIFGVCRFEHPSSPFDSALIAWGGAVAQFVVAAPLATYVLAGGYRGFEPLNAVLAILGFLSPGIALFNLLPIAGLDGRRAWTLVPLLRARRRELREPRRPQTTMEAMEEALRKARRP